MSSRLQVDLAWLAGATPLMSGAYWATRGVHAAVDVFADADPGLDAEPVRQVGRWFERVHLAGLEAARVEVLAANLAIRDGGHTLGELDVLYRHRGLVVHREVAVKYYLAAREGVDPSCWIGPGRRDRLDLKLDRMRTHQLTLPQRAEAAGAWPEALPAPDRSEVLLLGALFSPPDDRRRPEGAHPDVEHGCWYFASEFAERFANAQWCVLDKPWWLSREHARGVETVSATTLAQNLRAPRLVARTGAVVERAFVVPDGWWTVA